MELVAIDKKGLHIPITLSSLLGKGGEGEVYEILDNSDLCVKIYYKAYRTHERAEKIRYMIRHSIAGNNAFARLCWPIAEIRSPKQHYKEGFFGFVMPKALADSQELQRLTSYANEKRLEIKWHKFFVPSLAFELRMKICSNLCIAVYLVHKERDYVFVDLKPHNIMITYDGRVCLVDLDSIQINAKKKFYARVSTPEYTPPEGMGVTVKEKLVDVTWDRFSLATILYQILFGIHPFSASFKPPFDNVTTIHKSIENRLFVHDSETKNHIRTLPKPHYKFFSLHNDIKLLFERAFMSTDRPTVENWAIVLSEHIKNNTHGLR